MKKIGILIFVFFTLTCQLEHAQGMIGLFSNGIFFIDLEGTQREIDSIKPNELVPAPNGFIGRYRNGVYFTDLRTHVDHRWSSDVPSVIVAAPDGFIGVYSNGVFYTDSHGKVKNLSKSKPSMLVSAPGGMVGVYKSGNLFTPPLSPEGREILQYTSILCSK